MNPTVVKIGVGVVCGALFLLYRLYKDYRDAQRCQQIQGSCNFHEDNINICCICLCEFGNSKNEQEVLTLQCKHRFHRLCIKDLLFKMDRRSCCPLCRSSISQDFIRLHFKSEFLSGEGLFLVQRR